MSAREEITKAIGVHGMWKSHIRSAIDSGKSDLRPENVSIDSQCEFGKWLYGGTIPAESRNGAHYETVRRLHAEFHKVAAEVLKLALAGRADEATRMISPNSAFANLSANLTTSMMAWAKSS